MISKSSCVIHSELQKKLHEYFTLGERLLEHDQTNAYIILITYYIWSLTQSPRAKHARCNSHSDLPDRILLFPVTFFQRSRDTYLSVLIIISEKTTLVIPKSRQLTGGACNLTGILGSIKILP